MRKTKWKDRVKQKTFFHLLVFTVSSNLPIVLNSRANQTTIKNIENEGKGSDFFELIFKFYLDLYPKCSYLSKYEFETQTPKFLHSF